MKFSTLLFIFFCFVFVLCLWHFVDIAKLLQNDFKVQQTEERGGAATAATRGTTATTAATRGTTRAMPAVAGN